MESTAFPVTSEAIITYHPDTDIRNGALGGLLIGLASTVYMLFTGRISGLSSILEGFITFDSDTFRFKAAFMGGLIHGGIAVVRLLGAPFSGLPDPHLDSLSIPVLIISGFMVGFGTRLGNGCTSGHGVVGLGRRSPRSFASVLVFLFTAMAVASQYGQMFGNASHVSSAEPMMSGEHIFLASTIGGFASFLLAIYLEPAAWRDSFVSYVSGLLFSAGLAISGMNHPSKVVNFLKIGKNWDPSLLFVLGSSVGINLITFHWAHEHMEAPLLAKFWPEEHPEEKVTFTTMSSALDLKLILGAVFFGLGWGISGICPGPGVLLVSGGSQPATFFFAPSMMAGMALAVYAKKHYDRELIPPVQPRAAARRKATRAS